MYQQTCLTHSQILRHAGLIVCDPRVRYQINRVQIIYTQPREQEAEDETLISILVSWRLVEEISRERRGSPVIYRVVATFYYYWRHYYGRGMWYVIVSCYFKWRCVFDCECNIYRILCNFNLLRSNQSRINFMLFLGH